MAATWIKVGVDLQYRREVLVMSRLMQCSIAEVIGLCVLFWSWADSQTTNGYVEQVTFMDANRVVGREGFAEAMYEAGWLLSDDGGLLIPRFERHNGNTAKSRALNYKAQHKHRANNGQS